MRKIKLDYTLETSEERKAVVDAIIAEEGENLSPYYLEILANYLVVPKEKEEKKERQILTDNRLSTISKRETSFEGLSAQFENGEDGLYNLVKDNDKSVLFQPKHKITPEEIESIPELKQINETIAALKCALAKASGKEAYIIKNAIIDLQKDQYIVRSSYRPTIGIIPSFGGRNYVSLAQEEIKVNEDGSTEATGISLLRPEVCAAILKYYCRLKESSWNNFYSDSWYLMQSFDELAQNALAKQPPYYEALVTYKIDGLSNQEIQKRIKEEFGVYHTVEHLSTLWTKKIPTLIAEEAEAQYLDYHFLEKEKGQYKKCTRCGQIKLKTTQYFSKNKTSKDGYYSICKKCRSKKGK